MSALSTNTTLKSYPALNTTTTSANTQSNADSTGTIIFGVLASVLALMAIIIGIVQLCKTNARTQADGEA
ncbi:hypothetical protein Q7P35_011836 [Cladosporium inversicolor]